MCSNRCRCYYNKIIKIKVVIGQQYGVARADLKISTVDYSMRVFGREFAIFNSSDEEIILQGIA